MPGAIIRYRPISPRAYRISHVQAHGWQVVYRSTDTQGMPVADVATLLVPRRDRGLRLENGQSLGDAVTGANNSMDFRVARFDGRNDSDHDRLIDDCPDIIRRWSAGP